MRKKKCFWSLIVSALFVGCLTSCDDVIPNDSVVENGNKNSQGTNNTSEGSTGSNGTNSEGTSNGTNNNSQTVRYSIEDNEITQMVFNEFKKTFSDITYEDFRINGRKSTNSDGVRYSYMSSDIELRNNIFSSKAIRINGTSTFSKYINNEWVKTQEYYYIGSQFYITYELEFNDDNTFKLIRECTFDENGNRLTQKITRYINNEWIKTLDSIYINGEPITIYSASLNSDNIITSINEYTIDDEGNYLTCKSSILSDGKWAINEFVYINGKSTFIGSTQLNEDKSYNFKWEYTRDENGNLVASKRFNYINNEWILVTHYVYINGEEKDVYFIAFKDDNTFNSKDENSYDENGNVLTWTRTKYINGEWINDFKRECTYDENGNELTSIDYKYINNDWVKIWDIKTINGHMKTMLKINFNANGEYESKYVYTYDENGNELTSICSKYSNNEWVEVLNCCYINGERKTTYYLSFNQDGTFNSKYVYTYDENGNELTSICSKYSNNDWTYYEKYEYTYDANGNKLTEIKSKYSNNDWANESKNEYTYDENNNLLTIFYYVYINNIPTLLDKTIYNYSSNLGVNIKDEKYYLGNSLWSHTEYWFINNEWVKFNEYKVYNDQEKMVYSLNYMDGEITGKVESTYDNNGNMLTWIESNYKNEWTYSSKHEYTYNVDNKVLTYTESIYDNNEWIYKYKFENTYDEDSVILTNTHYSYKNNEWVKTLGYIYINGNQLETYSNAYYEEIETTIISENTFTEDGKVLTGTSLCYNNNNEITSGTKREKTYDANGNEIRYTNSEYKNGEWVYKYKYEYTYDEDGNELTSTRYDFINGEWVIES